MTKNQRYYDEFMHLLQKSRNENIDLYENLGNLLFDMSIDLDYCLGAIKVITVDQSLPINPSRLRVLTEAENRLETWTHTLKKSLIDTARDS